MSRRQLQPKELSEVSSLVGRAVGGGGDLRARNGASCRHFPAGLQFPAEEQNWGKPMRRVRGQCPSDGVPTVSSTTTAPGRHPEPVDAHTSLFLSADQQYSSCISNQQSLLIHLTAIWSELGCLMQPFELKSAA